MRYVLGPLIALVAGLVCLPLSMWLEAGNLVMVFLAAVALAAYLWGRGPSVLAALVGVLVYDYFFVPPYLTFAVHDKQYLITFCSLVIGALVISSLTRRAREGTRREEQAAALQASEAFQSALLNSVSHDLRIPLVSITGALSALSEEGVYQDPETRRALLDNARSEADRLNRLVTNLLQLSRLESGTVKVEKVPCDVEDLIATTLPVLGLADVSLDLAPDLPLVEADYVLLQLVLLNLLENARKYASDITVGAHVVEGQLELSVADRGPGLAPGEPIFTKFYRGSGARGPGTGLGLFICQGLVQAHNGTLTAEARAGGGTTFRVRLPLS